MRSAVCPVKGFTDEKHKIERTGSNVYRCTCGTIFTWTGTFQWVILECPFFKGKFTNGLNIPWRLEGIR